MSINKSEITIGGKYKTPENQERIVIGCNTDNKVVYASRGGNVKNRFDHREASSLNRFAEACSEKIGQLSENELAEIIKICNGLDAISGGENCLEK